MAALPSKPVGIYWETYYPVGGTRARVTLQPNPTEYPSGYYNVIFLFQALPTTPTGAVSFPLHASITQAQMNADIVTCRNRGQRVILTVGGASAQVDITDLTKADAFVASIKSINVLLGGSGQTAAIDGVDFNSYEGIPASGRWITYACLRLKAYYGSTFQITSPPSCTNYLNQRTLDRGVLAEMHAGGTYTGVDGTYTGTALDWFCPQFYDGPGNNTSAQVQDTLDFYNTSITIPLNNGNTNPISQIPRSKIGIGYRCDSNTYSWTTANASAAYTTAVDTGKSPRGGFNFSANNNPTFTFASVVAPVILEGESESGTLTTIQRIRNVLVTNIATIRGRAIAQVQSWRGKT